MAVKDPTAFKASTEYGVDWFLHANDTTFEIFEHPVIQIILLQEIRDELKQLNRLLGCRNFTGIPATLQTIATNTTKRKYERKAKGPRT